MPPSFLDIVVDAWAIRGLSTRVARSAGEDCVLPISCAVGDTSSSSEEVLPADVGEDMRDCCTSEPIRVTPLSPAAVVGSQSLGALMLSGLLDLAGDACGEGRPCIGTMVLEDVSMAAGLRVDVGMLVLRAAGLVTVRVTEGRCP